MTTGTSPRAVVTGGSGFIGSHICRELISRGWQVVVLDNLLTGRLSNLEHLRNESHFEFLEQDVCLPIECGALDYVFHFASPASPVDYATHGIETLRVGSYGTFETLELARRHGARLRSMTFALLSLTLIHPLSVALVCPRR